MTQRWYNTSATCTSAERGLSLLLVPALLRGLFSGFSYLTFFKKADISKFQFYQDKGPAWAAADVASSLNIEIYLNKNRKDTLFRKLPDDYHFIRCYISHLRFCAQWKPQITKRQENWGDVLVVPGISLYSLHRDPEYLTTPRTSLN